MSKDKQTNRPLTLKQERFVAAVSDPKTKSRTQAALVAGYGKAGAPQRASENVKKRHISEAIENHQRDEMDKARAPLVSIERLLKQSLKALEAAANGPMDTATAGAIADLAAKLQRGQLDLADRYPDPMGNGSDKDSLRREARSIQLVMLHVLEAAIARPAVAERMLRRLRAQFSSEEPERDATAPAEGTWKPGGRDDDAWRVE